MHRNNEKLSIVDVESPDGKEDHNLLLAPWNHPGNNHIMYTRGNSQAVALPSPRTPSSIFSFPPRSPDRTMRQIASILIHNNDEKRLRFNWICRVNFDDFLSQSYSSLLCCYHRLGFTSHNRTVLSFSDVSHRDKDSMQKIKLADCYSF